jgi:hypothetical protein
VEECAISRCGDYIGICAVLILEHAVLKMARARIRAVSCGSSQRMRDLRTETLGRATRHPERFARGPSPPRSAMRSSKRDFKSSLCLRPVALAQLSRDSATCTGRNQMISNSLQLPHTSRFDSRCVGRQWQHPIKSEVLYRIGPLEPTPFGRSDKLNGRGDGII